MMRVRSAPEALARLQAVLRPHVAHLPDEVFVASFAAAQTLCAEKFQHCRICGGSERDPCGDGCRMVRPNLCSCCVTAAMEAMLDGRAGTG